MPRPVRRHPRPSLAAALACAALACTPGADDASEAARPLAVAAGTTTMTATPMPIGGAAGGPMMLGPGPTCVTANPNHCAMAKSQETPPPPPQNYVLTSCTYQVLFEDIEVTDGQGISESKLEISVASDAGGGAMAWPASGQQIMEKDFGRHPDQLVATHTVAKGAKKTIEVCATITEVDNGGLNGKPDVGSDCQTITLECNKRALQAPPLQVALAADLCRGNERDERGNCKHFNGRANLGYEVTLIDRDWDGVPADQDFTPDPEDEACRGQEGRGVVLFSQYGTSNINEIVGQMGMGVDEMVENYDFVAIAMNPTDVLGFTVREEILARADMVVEPTLDGLMAAMRGATRRGFDISLYVAGHGTTINTTMALFTSADPDGFVDENEIRRALAPHVSGTCAVPMRMVFGIPCYFSQSTDAWRDNGAHAATGPQFVGMYPQEGNVFARRWNAGDSFGMAVGSSIDPVIRTLNAGVIELWGQPYCLAQFGTLASPLAMNSCASWFFTGGGGPSINFGGDYDATISGLANMNAGSQQMPAGTMAITKFSPLTW